MAFSRDTIAAQKAEQQWNTDQTGEWDTQFQTLPVMFNKVPRIYESEEFLALPEQEREFLLRDQVPTYEATIGGPLPVPPEEVPEGYEFQTLVVFGMNTQSTGSVTLASADPNDKPVLDLGTYTDASGFDIKVMVEGVKDVVGFFEKTQMYKNGFVKWLEAPETFGEEEVVEGWLREKSITVWHACGTVKMGRKGEEGTCVDSEFRVLGVEGLRVVDMSVAPVLIR